MDVVACLSAAVPIALEGLPLPATPRLVDPWKAFLAARAGGEVYPMVLPKVADLDLIPRAPKGGGSSSGVSLPKSETRVFLLSGGAVRCWVPLVGIMDCVAGPVLLLAAGLAETAVVPKLSRVLKSPTKAPSWFAGVRDPWWHETEADPGPAWSTAVLERRPLVELQAVFICGRGRGKGRGCTVLLPCVGCGKIGDLLCDRETGEGSKTCDASICAGCALAIGPDRHLCPACAALGTVARSPAADEQAPRPTAQKAPKRGKAAPAPAPRAAEPPPAAPPAPVAPSPQRTLF